MKQVTRGQLLKRTGSIYKLCNLAAMRAIELNSGMKKLVDSHPNEKITTVAIREIAAGMVWLAGVPG
ncbi:MAG: DNA-directed RNA polymerase subunit omega [Candidatus Omnitrophota bacterium]